MIEITNNKVLERFQTKNTDEIAFVEYSVQDKKIFLGKTSIPESFSEVTTNTFLKAVLEECVAQKLRIVPTSSIVVNFIKNNKEYKEYLATGIRI